MISIPHASGFFSGATGALLLRCAALVFLLLGFSVAWADPPSRAGRIANVAGSAWLLDPDTNGWVRVLRNQTVSQGDQLRTDARSRVTVRVGSTTLWLDEQSDMQVLQMEDTALVVRLLAGDVALRLRTAQAAQETRVQTREGMVSPEMEGLFRIDQLDRGTRLAVLEGRAQFESDARARSQRGWLREGEQSEFLRNESGRVERQAVSRDKFSAWFLSKDEAEAVLAWGEDPYVSPEMTGAEELNKYGSWEVVAEYGNVWIPTRVVAGWEPYRDGNWVWTRHWGWSWVDNAPWGFAPFHYGRWLQYDGRWAWAPGRFEPRPAYSPGLVAWAGGPQLSIGITVGGIRRPPQTGWAPLAPRQIYAPPYAHSPQYIERFRWNGGSPSYGIDQRDERNRPLPQRGDAGPQPYRAVPQAGVGSTPFNRGVIGTDNRQVERPEYGNPFNGQGDRRIRPPVLPPLQPIAPGFPAQQPVQPSPMPPQQAPAFGPAQVPPIGQRDVDRSPRYRELIQSVQPVQVIQPQSPPQPPALTQIPPQQPPARAQAPVSNRESAGWPGTLQNQRPPTPPAQPAVQAPPAQAMPQSPPPPQAVAPAGPRPQAKSVDDDDAPNGKRNKRENKEREYR
ncbi:MAG: FecR domain-containing protein [Candidatus Saccharibacteria bacterium]|nr:FecR domain-containing protein [Rhodoferax sp.]